MTTAVKPLTESAYIEIATGPCVAASANSAQFCVHIGTVAPAANTLAYHTTCELSYAGTEKVFARSLSGALNIIVTEVL